jgi:hypothetical protein
LCLLEISSAKITWLFPNVLIVGTFAGFALMTCAACNIEIKQIVPRIAAQHIKTGNIDAEHLLKATVVSAIRDLPNSALSAHDGSHQHGMACKAGISPFLICNQL